MPYAVWSSLRNNGFVQRIPRLVSFEYLTNSVLHCNIIFHLYDGDDSPSLLNILVASKGAPGRLHAKPNRGVFLKMILPFASQIGNAIEIVQKYNYSPIQPYDINSYWFSNFHIPQRISFRFYNNIRYHPLYSLLNCHRFVKNDFITTKKMFLQFAVVLNTRFLKSINVSSIFFV